MTEKAVLAAVHWRNVEVPLLLAAAAAALGFGLHMPTITFKEMVFWKHTFSIVTGIQGLYQDKQYALAALVGFFSVVFPIVKITVLTAIWFLPLTRKIRLRLVRLLGALGKWSMLDVFIVAIMIVISRLSGVMKAAPRAGIYVFAASIICAMIVTVRIESLSKRENPRLKPS